MKSLMKDPDGQKRCICKLLLSEGTVCKELVSSSSYGNGTQRVKLAIGIGKT